MNNIINLNQIEYRSRSYDSKVKQQSYVGRLARATLSYMQDWTGYNDQICIRRLTTRGVEVESTGITKEMIEKFCKGNAAEHEAIKIKEMLSSATGRDLSKLPDQSLRTLSKLLITADNSIELIKTILSSPSLERVLKRLETDLTVLKNKNLWPELLCQILSSNSPSHVLDILKEHPEWLNRIPHELWGPILLAEDPVTVLKTLVNGEKITHEHLSQILSTREPNDLLREFSAAVIGNDGKINTEEVKIRRKFINIEDPRHSAQVNRVIDLLENDIKFRTLIENIKAPGEMEGSETVKSYIRTMLYLEKDVTVTKVDAQRAVLGAVLSDIRQSNIGSCYGSAIAICVHDNIPHLMVEDLASIIEKGYFTRKGSSDKAEERFYIGEGFNFSDRTKFQMFKSSASVTQMFNKLSNAYPEFKEIFVKAAKDIEHSSYSSFSASEVLGPVFDDLAKYFEVTEDDLKKERELQDLLEQIRTLSVEASLNNEKELDKKVQRLIISYDTKVKELGNKLLKLETYHETESKLSKIFFVEWNRMNLLAKGWEYAILSAELREIEREHEISPTKIPPMMREVFKETLFNNDEGAIFIKEMNKVLETLRTLQNQFDEKQKNQLSEILTEIVKTMKSIVDERITVRTINIRESDTGHYLVYALGKDIGKFKVLNKEKEYSEAIAGCMMEAFEKVLKDTSGMDMAIKGFLIKSKGILGDKLQSKEFRHSLNSLIMHSAYPRLHVFKQYGIRTSSPSLPVSSVYFEQEYSRNLLQIDSLSLEIHQSPAFKKFLEWAGHRREVGITDVKNYNEHEQYFRDFKDFEVFLDKIRDNRAVSSMAIMGLLTISSAISWIFGGIVASLITITTIFLRGNADYRSPDADILEHFIEANRRIYKNVKNHNEWIKYPIWIPNHVCNLIPFNKTIRGIVASDEDIKTHIQRMIANQEKTIVAVMDLNYKNECYAGFELGKGTIRKIFLDSKFEYAGDVDVNEYFSFAYMNEANYKVVDEKISKYAEG